MYVKHNEPRNAGEQMIAGNKSADREFVLLLRPPVGYVTKSHPIELSHNPGSADPEKYSL